ncbi:hypothetical protein NCS57_01484600 [Fusarium keratoplasticum]|uniref:Uncharacterized protein n=1 Tax=Fusarium keratoplasticum TaxID=1328300 RepID=A0ACC0QA29_9HYPO|nr:hypothetical protein NCS57_01484600 [Fusarium keratoplasticum]KAI8648168.1 hypothetical protein NCS57_01484600 [Fusarium keratoplasticum]
MADSNFKPGYDTCDEVTPQCPVEATLYGDYFTKGPIIFFAVAFGLLLLYQIWFTFKSRAWGFSIWLILGTVFEMVGYSSRMEMVDNPWKKDPFQKQLLLLILAPTLIAASIAVTFKHLVLYYGPDLSVLRPRWYPFVFVGTDIIAIIIQGAGAAFLVGGVSFQLVNMLGCGLLMVIFWKRYQLLKHDGKKTERRDVLIQDGQVDSTEYRNLRWFVWAIFAAYILIIIRCIYRVPEMALGWGSSLMQNEALFYILDGVMILLAVTIICAFHPARFFPRLGRAKDMAAPTPAQIRSHVGRSEYQGSQIALRQVVTTV